MAWLCPAFRQGKRWKRQACQRVVPEAGLGPPAVDSLAGRNIRIHSTTLAGVGLRRGLREKKSRDCVWLGWKLNSQRRALRVVAELLSPKSLPFLGMQAGGVGAESLMRGWLWVQAGAERPGAGRLEAYEPPSLKTACIRSPVCCFVKHGIEL